MGSPPRSVALVLFAAGSRGGSRRGLCEWSGVRCDDGVGAAGDECGRTTPWGKSNPAVPTAGSVAPLDGEEGGKNASEERRGQEGAEQHRVCVARRQPGWAARAGDGSPARRWWRYACLGPAPTPRHSELRQPAPRALSRAVGWWRCRHGASRALTQTCRPQPRQIDATRGQRRCPKVPAGCRTAAGRPPSLRTWPLSHS